MKKNILWIGIFFLFLLLASCATIKKDTSYTIIYHTQDDKIETKSYYENTKLTEQMLPNDLTKEGFIPEKWYLDENYETVVVFPYTVIKNEDFYLKWIPDESIIQDKVTIQLIIDSNTTEQSIIKGSSFTKPTDPKAKEGYTFKGWSTSKDSYQAYDFTKIVTDNMTLYAYYEPKSYSVQYIVDNKPYFTDTIEHNHTVTEITKPELAQHSFDGWYIDATYETKFNFNTPITQETKLYGRFIEITSEPVQITLHIEDTTSTSTVLHGQTLAKPTDPKAKEGYTFKGWSTSKDSYQAYDFTKAVISPFDLYAYYEINTYKVEFFIDNKSYTTQTIEYQKTASKPADPTDLNNQKVDGWYTDKECQSKFDFTTKITSSISLYAKLVNLASYTVTFEVNGKTYQTIPVAENGLVSKPADPTLDKMNFVGWLDENNEIFNFDTKITNNIVLTAKFEETKLNVKTFSSSAEAILIEIEKVASVPLSNYHFSYKLAKDANYTLVDSQLVQELSTSIRCDIVGLTAGSYSVKATVSAAEEMSITKSIQVTAYDRSGYAHFNATTGIGAYNDDGTLKSNALVVYVTNETKNTVTASIGGKTYTGLAAILKAQADSNIPLDLRIIGKITTNQWAPKDVAPRLTDNSNLQKDTFWVNDFETKYGDNLVGLTVKYMDKYTQKSYTYTTTAKGLSSAKEGNTGKKETTYNGSKYPDIKGKKVYDDDSYWNMLDISNVSNVTIEGIGSTAEFFQWGITWSNCNSIEVRNITFTDNTEDACSFQGDDKDPTKCGRYWIHHNVFNRGKNNWDVSGERDKSYGDGSTDFKGCYGITSCYNVFNNCKKTGLVGGGDTVLTKDVTFHHNYYNTVGSRLPLGRQANMHFYNNYYYKCSTCQDIRANAFVFSENNYFDGCTNAQLVTTNSTYAGTVIKSYQDYFTGGKTQSTKVTDRTQTLNGNCKPDGSTNYTNFDTNETLFYYDSVNKRSNVAVLTNTSDVPTFTVSHAGVLKEGYDPSAQPSTPVDPTPTPEEPASWVEQLNETFTSTQTITQVDAEPTSAGLYYRYALTKSGVTTSTADSTTNNMNISNGALNIVDTSDTDTTFGYYMFNETYQSGKVRITLDFLPQTANGKWTMIHFLDGSTNIGIRSNDTKVLGYSYNGTDVAVQNQPYTAGKTYTVVLTIDFDNQSASISINGTTKVISGYTPTSLKGIMFQTASASRSFSIDNLKIETAK